MTLYQITQLARRQGRTETGYEALVEEFMVMIPAPPPGRELQVLEDCAEVESFCREMQRSFRDRGEPPCR